LEISLPGMVNLSKIKKITEDFFSKMGVSGKIKVELISENTVSLNLETDEPQILIGKEGQTLSEIQRLLLRILRKQIKEMFFIDLDVNDYKKKKFDYLKELAKQLADEVVLTKKEKILSPMPSYERRVIHLEISKREDVKSESTGEEPERRIVIKPII